MHQLPLHLDTRRQAVQRTLALPLPAPGGLRSAAPRHLVFLTGEHLLDVEVEYADHLTIVGQLVNKSYRAVTDATVQAVSEHGVLESSVTGSGGEFVVACRPRGSMRLTILVSDEALIELPLPRHPGVH